MRRRSRTILAVLVSLSLLGTAPGASALASDHGGAAAPCDSVSPAPATDTYADHAPDRGKSHAAHDCDRSCGDGCGACAHCPAGAITAAPAQTVPAAPRERPVAHRLPAEVVPEAEPHPPRDVS